MTFDFDIFRVLVGSCRRERGSIDFVGIVGGRNLRWLGNLNQNGINYEAGQAALWLGAPGWKAPAASWRTPSESGRSNERRMLETCRRGFVSLRGFAGGTPPHGVDAGHAEAIVDVSVKLEDGRVMVSRHSMQFLPIPRLPLALLVLDNKLCWQAGGGKKSDALLLCLLWKDYVSIRQLVYCSWRPDIIHYCSLLGKKWILQFMLVVCNI